MYCLVLFVLKMTTVLINGRLTTVGFFTSFWSLASFAQKFGLSNWHPASSLVHHGTVHLRHGAFGSPRDDTVDFGASFGVTRDAHHRKYELGTSS